MSNLDSLLLSEDQLKLYLSKLAERGIDHTGARSIPRRPPGSRVPACSYQEPLWFIDRLTDGDTAHNVVYPMGLPEGDIDEGALMKAIERMIERQEILRTTFRQDDDLIEQVVHEEPKMLFDRVDLTTLPEDEREAAGWRLVDEEAAYRFSLDEGPLIKFTRLVAAPGKNVLIVSLHHIICDTWSVAIIDREVRTHYDDIVKGKPRTLPVPPVQFGDYAAWQRSIVGGGRYNEHLDYWMKRLVDAPRLQLPTDFPIPERRSHAASNSLVYIDEALLSRVKSFARSEGVTLYMVLLTAFKIMLARHTGQDDIVVGTPHANREHPEMRDIIGFTINSLVMRTDLGGEPDFRTALRRVRDTALAAHEHQDVPFQVLVEKLGAQGRSAAMSRYSLFRAFFSVQNIRWADIELPQINTGALHNKPRFTVPHPTTKYDIYMYLRERDGKVLGGLEYDTELFKLSRIERMIRHFLRIVEQGISHPGTGIHALSMLDGEEVAALVAWEGRAAPSPRADIPSAFEAAVERWPQAMALDDGERRLSYRELEAEAAGMSAALVGAGVTPGQRVGLLCDRSVRAMTAVLAILRCGAVCVPLDRSAPAQRTETALRAYDIRWLVHDEDADLGEESRRLALGLATLSGGSAAPSRPRLSPADTAFVFLTSGSTGVPNAVDLTHASVLQGQLPETCPHPIGASDRLLMSAPFSSARLLGELLWPLCNGAGIVLCRPAGHQDPEYLGSMLQRHEITHFSVVPQVLAQLLDQQSIARAAALKLVYCVGQNLEQDLVERFASQTSAKLYNSYAQTEACPVTFQACAAGDPAGRVPVGRPAAGTAVHVLGARLETLPVGVTGQVAVAGACVAQGYPGKPALTAEKFVPDPHGAPGSRMYLTGDLAQWQESGSLVLMGRSDQRVKIRGYRIDLGDIESALMSVPGVREAAVVARSDGDAEPMIVAFVRSDPEPEPAAATAALGGLAALVRGLAGRRKPEEPTLPRAQQLRAALQLKLPFYMLPSRIVAVEELPLGRTGKLDRQALLGLLPQLAAPAVADGTPRDDTERALVEIWREVLALPSTAQIGIYDSFFELGGHSLLAIKIVKRIQTRLKISLEIRHVFEAVTIAGLADLIRWEQSAESFDEIELDEGPAR